MVHKWCAMVKSIECDFYDGLAKSNGRYEMHQCHYCFTSYSLELRCPLVVLRFDECN